MQTSMLLLVQTSDLFFVKDDLCFTRCYKIHAFSDMVAWQKWCHFVHRHCKNKPLTELYLTGVCTCIRYYVIGQNFADILMRKSSWTTLLSFHLNFWADFIKIWDDRIFFVHREETLVAVSGYADLKGVCRENLHVHSLLCSVGNKRWCHQRKM